MSNAISDGIAAVTTNHHVPEANKTQHNFIICAWLIDKFGIDFFRKNSTLSSQKVDETGYILDVAGGNGMLSYEFSVRYGINSVLYERRKNIKLSSMMRRKMKKITKGYNRLFNHSIVSDECKSNSDTAFAIRNNEAEMRVDKSPMIDFLLCHLIKSAANSSQSVVQILPRVEDSISNDSVLPFFHISENFPIYAKDILTSSSAHSDNAEISATENLSFYDIIENKSLLTLIQNCNMIIGVHSDEATECIIDIAVSQRIPFCIVPCCIFNNLYPDRKVLLPNLHETNNSTSCEVMYGPVQNYDDFVRYLKSKHANIKQDVLPFHGRNIVLYCVDYSS